MSGKHFALVVSARLFNTLGLAMVCPISQGEAGLARSQGFLVSLMGAATEIPGNVHCHQLRALDLRTRRALRKERVPASASVSKEVAEVLDAILFDE